jgi:hypothetical protein
MILVRTDHPCLRVGHHIISDKLSSDETQRLVATLEKYQLVIGYSLKDLKGISLSLCIHRIRME